MDLASGHELAKFFPIPPHLVTKSKTTVYFGALLLLLVVLLLVLLVPGVQLVAGSW